MSDDPALDALMSRCVGASTRLSAACSALRVAFEETEPALELGRLASESLSASLMRLSSAGAKKDEFEKAIERFLQANRPA